MKEYKITRYIFADGVSEFLGKCTRTRSEKRERKIEWAGFDIKGRTKKVPVRREIPNEITKIEKFKNLIAQLVWNFYGKRGKYTLKDDQT